MGDIRDLIDLVTQLANRVRDRKLAEELNAIQSLILGLQAEEAELHKTNIGLREEVSTLKQRIQELEAQILEWSSAASHAPGDVPTCLNCSTKSKPFYMRPIAEEFRDMVGATHECPKCGWRRG